MVLNQGTLPRYPKNAMNEGVEGEVKVRVFVDVGGGLEKADLLETSGDFRLDKVTVSSLERGWKFKPETEKYYIDLVFSFRIKTGISILFVNSETRP
jgi:protein TonB